jgi:hypothetical protein
LDDLGQGLPLRGTQKVDRTALVPGPAQPGADWSIRVVEQGESPLLSWLKSLQPDDPTKTRCPACKQLVDKSEIVGIPIKAVGAQTGQRTQVGKVCFNKILSDNPWTVGR